MTHVPSRPPRLAEWLVARVVADADAREAVLGDLNERYHSRAMESSIAAANRWYWRQAAEFVLRVPLSRISRLSDHPATSPGDVGGIDGRGRRRYALDAIGEDLRMAARSVIRGRATMALVVLTMAAAIGSTTLMFTVFEGVLLRPLPYASPGELVNVWLVNAEFLDADNPESRLIGERFPVSRPVYEAWRDLPTSPFAALGAYSAYRPMLGPASEGERVAAVRANAALFATLGVAARIGRTFTADEDAAGGSRVAVLTDGMWRSSFGGRADVLGATVTIGGTAHTIIGVMPPGFYFPTTDHGLIVPFSDADRRGDANSFGLQLVGRLRAGIDASGAEAALAVVADRIGRETGIYTGTAPAHVLSRRELIVGDVATMLAVMLGTVLVVLLVACANVASLLLVRAAGRRHEYAVRAALGAGWSRVLRQQFFETALMVVGGGALGLAIAVVALEPVLELAPGVLPREEEVALNGAVVAFALAITALAAFLAGLLPAARAGRAAPAAALRHDPRTGRVAHATRVQRVLVTAEVAAAFALLAGAGLLVLSWERLNSVDMGYDVDRLIAAEVHLSRADGDASARIPLLVERLEAIPGVSAVGAASSGPFSGAVHISTMSAEQPDGTVLRLPGASISALPGFLPALGARFVVGRDLDRPAGGGGDEVVITRTAARRLWGSVPAALGRHIRVSEDAGDPLRTVVGVIDDLRMSDVAEDPGAHVFVQMEPSINAWFGIRTSLPPEALLPAVRTALAGVDAGVRLNDLTVLRHEVDEALAPARFRMTVLSALAAMAGLLAVLGVYGVMAFSVALRRDEMGVRLALGARPGQVLRGIVAQGVRLAVIGIAIGTVIAVPSSRLLQEFLFGVGPVDPATLAAVAVLLVCVGAAAAYVPARRVARLDPARVLRSE